MNHVDKIAYEYAKEHGDVGFDYGKVYDAVKYGYNRALEDTWKPSEHELKVLKLVAEKDGTCLMGLYDKLKSL